MTISRVNIVSIFNFHMTYGGNFRHAVMYVLNSALVVKSDNIVNGEFVYVFSFIF